MGILCYLCLLSYPGPASKAKEIYLEIWVFVMECLLLGDKSLGAGEDYHVCNNGSKDMPENILGS